MIKYIMGGHPRPPQKVDKTPVRNVFKMPKDYSAQLKELHQRALGEERDLTLFLDDGRELATAHYDPRHGTVHIVIHPDIRDEVRLPWR